MPEKVLLISPHPDDAEFGVGMTLLNHLDRGDTVKSLVICLGNNPAEYSTREDELNLVRESGDYAVDLLDKAAPTDLHALITGLEARIREFQPDVMYLPFGQDRHQDHKIVSEAAGIAGRTVANRYYYCTPSTRGFEANHYFVGDRYLLERKIELLGCFFSQREKAYLSPHEIRAYAQTSGRNALLYSGGIHFAEPFVTQTLQFAPVAKTSQVPARTEPEHPDPDFLPRSFARLAEILQGRIDPARITGQQFPWEVLALIPQLNLAGTQAQRLESRGELRVEGEVFAESGARLPASGVIKGPVYIAADSDVQDYSVVIGPAFIGPGARVGYHSSVRGCVLGPEVQIGQRVDLTRTIILDRTMLSHGNTVGDAFIGRDCWLAGKTDVANLRVDRRPVRANIGGKRHTTLGKYGATIEDGVQFPALVVMLPGAYVSASLKMQIRDLISGNRVHKTRK